MIYNYKCQSCGEISEIAISTYDIIDNVGRVNQDALTKRMYEDRFCECGGRLKKLLTVPKEPLWFNAGIGKGKISKRFQ